ncbi:MAG TPA: hypothetical protein PL181_17405 [bacterium]|nr:hypothetical protein [bacterium]
MPSNAVKMVYGATTVYFDAEEVLEAVYPQNTAYQVHIKQAEKPSIKYIGSEVGQLTISFDLMRQGTADKINQILSAGEELTIYPAMNFDPSLHLHCIPQVDGIEEVNTYGWDDADESSKTITFLQSAA